MTERVTNKILIPDQLSNIYLPKNSRQPYKSNLKQKSRDSKGPLITTNTNLNNQTNSDLKMKLSKLADQLRLSDKENNFQVKTSLESNRSVASQKLSDFKRTALLKAKKPKLTRDMSLTCQQRPESPLRKSALPQPIRSTSKPKYTPFNMHLNPIS